MNIIYTDIVINYILFAVSIMLFAFSFLQLTFRKKSRVNYMMAFMLFIVGCDLAYFWICYSGMLSLVPALMFSDIFLVFLLGPVIYSYTKTLVGENTEYTAVYMLRYVPAIAVLIFLLFYQAWRKVPLISSDHLYPDYSSSQSINIINRMSDIWLFTFIAVSAVKLFKFRRKNGLLPFHAIRSMFYLAASTLGGIVIMVFALYLGSNNLFTAALILVGLACVSFFLFSNRYPEYTQYVIRLHQAGRYKKALPESIDAQKTISLLREMMERENLHRDPDITIKFLSEKIGVRAHLFSRVLNEELGMNFKTFINKYRVNEAKRLLIENPEVTVLRIAHDTGFNSKSSFNSVFLKQTGITPTEFRKMKN